MYALTFNQIDAVFGGISDGDSGSGMGYNATPSQMVSNVTTNEQADVDMVDAIGNFFAGLWAGL